MQNCKKCGALMSDDFIFCGKCGEPVVKNAPKEMYVKTKKVNSLRRFERRLSKSVLLNGIFSALWILISLASSFLFFEILRRIRAGSAGINYALNQLIMKYEYVKEGLSLSYISEQLTQIVNYTILWAFLIFLTITVICGIALTITHILKIIEIKKRHLNRTTEKIGRIFARCETIFIILFAVLLVASLIMKGVV